MRIIKIIYNSLGNDEPMLDNIIFGVILIAGAIGSGMIALNKSDVVTVVLLSMVSVFACLGGLTGIFIAIKQRNPDWHKEARKP